jgi:F-type H+-transporting ATPase subunit gamma
MIPLIKLKRDLAFNQDLSKVIDVMKGIATARYYVLERQLTVFEPFFDATALFMGLMDLGRVQHPFVHGQGPMGVLMVTSNEGFLGGLNNQVINAGLKLGGPDGAFMLIGERGASYMQDSRRQFASFPGIEDARRYDLAVTVRDYVMTKLMEGEFSRLSIVYPKPLSFSSQQITGETLLPCTAWAKKPEGGPSRSTIWESSAEDVLEYVIGQWLTARLDLLFALSRLAELSARSIHLENSFQELLRRGKRLRQDYFRARHEVIDRSMREIFSAQLLQRRLEEAIAE